MLILPNVLSSEELEAVRGALSDAEFVDGKATASGLAADVKKNLQVARDGEEAAPLDQLIVGALTRHPLLQQWALPKRVLLPRYSKYEPGMEYGPHTDAPVMGGAQPLRSDVSITLFLNPPDTYDGGELSIQAETGSIQVKLPAGHAVAYSTNAIHQVMPVTRGERLAAVTWAQSYVPEENLRRILQDMHTALDLLARSQPHSPEHRLVDKCYNNLLRRFAVV